MKTPAVFEAPMATKDMEFRGDRKWVEGVTPRFHEFWTRQTLPTLGQPGRGSVRLARSHSELA
jgi:hypothetical protein